jgi:hypothetical protein
MTTAAAAAAASGTSAGHAFNHGYTFLFVATLVWWFIFNPNARRDLHRLKGAKGKSGTGSHVTLEFRLYTRAVHSRRICTLIVAPVDDAHAARELANPVHPWYVDSLSRTSA